jgi:hypothetical protein
MFHVAKLIELISECRGATFASFLYQTVDENKKLLTPEVSKFTVILGGKVETLYVKDIEILTSLLPKQTGLHKIATEQLLMSRHASLTFGVGHNPEYTQEHLWVYPQGLEHMGIRVHRDNGNVQVTGLVQKKDVIVPGTYKPDTRRKLTVAKDEIRRQLPSHKFRTLRLDHVAAVALNGEVIEFNNVITATG